MKKNISGGNSTKKLTQLEFITRCQTAINSVHLDYTHTVYKNTRTDVSVICKLHGEFKSNSVMLMKGIGCRVCHTLDHKGNGFVLTLAEYIAVANIIHDNQYNYSLLTENNFNNEKLDILCNTHGKFTPRKSAHISYSQMHGCPQCGITRSTGEDRIILFLKKNNIAYEYQKSFSWSKAINHKNNLPYDFYLPSYNILIEFDGMHHFKPIRYGGQTIDIAKQQFERTKFYDSIKTANALLKNIKLIRIPYTKLRNIDTILSSELNLKRNIT